MKTIILILLCVFLVGCKNSCPEDAKICPDGTVVVRTGFNCEFSPCECKVDSDCVIFGEDGDCNCGCYLKGEEPEERIGDCFCAAPRNCECVNGKCETKI